LLTGRFSLGIAGPGLVIAPAKRKIFEDIGNSAAPIMRLQLIARSRLAARPATRNGHWRMTLFALFGIFPALFGLAAEPPRTEQVVRRMVVRDEIILRIPVRPHPSPAFDWIERKGPKCLDADRLAGAMLSGPSSIDFVLRNRQRVRAHLDNDCPALDFYRGFYLQPDDERICAKRDTIRRRDGGSCRIERFKTLEPRAKR